MAEKAYASSGLPLVSNETIDDFKKFLIDFASDKESQLEKSVKKHVEISEENPLLYKFAVAHSLTSLNAQAYLWGFFTTYNLLKIEASRKLN